MTRQSKHSVNNIWRRQRHSNNSLDTTCEKNLKLPYLGLNLENAESLAPLFSSQHLVWDLWWGKCELRDVIYTFAAFEFSFTFLNLLLPSQMVILTTNRSFIELVDLCLLLWKGTINYGFGETNWPNSRSKLHNICVYWNGLSCWK